MFFIRDFKDIVVIRNIRDIIVAISSTTSIALKSLMKSTSL